MKLVQSPALLRYLRWTENPVEKRVSDCNCSNCRPFNASINMTMQIAYKSQEVTLWAAATYGTEQGPSVQHKSKIHTRTCEWTWTAMQKVTKYKPASNTKTAIHIHRGRLHSSGHGTARSTNVTYMWRLTDNKCDTELIFTWRKSTILCRHSKILNFCQITVG